MFWVPEVLLYGRTQLGPSEFVVVGTLCLTMLTLLPLAAERGLFPEDVGSTSSKPK